MSHLFLFLCCVLVTTSSAQEDGRTFLCDGFCTEGGVSVNDEYGYDKEDNDERDNSSDNTDDDDDVVWFDGSCVDSYQKCLYWAYRGDCKKSPRFMLNACPFSCGSCKTFANEEERALNERKQKLEKEEYKALLKIEVDRIEAEMQEYLAAIRSSYDMREIWDLCKDTNRNCSFWAATGECQINSDYMHKACPVACTTCDQLRITTRCPLDPNTPDAWQPGSLNEFFTNITTMEEYKEYEPKILSRPEYAQDGDTTDEEPIDTYEIGAWVVILENFLSHEEADRLIELGAQEGYQRSSEFGEQKSDGTYLPAVKDGRTSTNAWCHNSCAGDPRAKAVVQRITNLTNIPQTNSEALQLLRYEVGQFYNTHHDYVDHQRDRQQGSRLLTVFLYLNDVEKGGGTYFPRLNITVQPKKGRALIWPSVLNEAPNDKDWWTVHGALPVEKGVKYGANAWIHQRDFQGPYRRNCV